MGVRFRCRELQLLVGKSFVIVFEVYCSAMSKTVTQKHLLHRYVVSVSVNSQVREALEALVDAKINDAGAIVAMFDEEGLDFFVSAK